MSTPTERWPVRLHDQALDEALSFIATRARKQHGTAQQATAKRIGISAPALCNWEKMTYLPARLSKWQAWFRSVGLRFVIEVYDAGGKKLYPNEASDR